MMSSSFYDVIFGLDNDVISKERLAKVTYFLSMRHLLPFSPIIFAPYCSCSASAKTNFIHVLLYVKIGLNGVEMMHRR